MKQAIRMSEVPAAVEALTGCRPHRTTVARWRTVGVAGVRLQAERVGGCFVTRPDWLSDFLAGVNAGEPTVEPVTALSPTARSANERAKAELARMGV